jgi:predicted dithiol-disulfide oxidoreductase (DUF899 family)
MQTDDKVVAASIVDRSTYLAEVERLRAREKAHTREADAIAAARRQLPMVEVDATAELIGERGPTTLLGAFEGRRMLIAYYFMWHEGKAAPDQCEGCTYFTQQVCNLAVVHSRDVTYATLCQGPFEESRRYRDFMGWEMPWYSAKDALPSLLAGRRIGMMHLISYLRRGNSVYETYWTWMRGVEAMDNNYHLLDLTAYGRQESWEVSPTGWPKPFGSGKQHMRRDGRPIGQWPRLNAGYSDDLLAHRDR